MITPAYAITATERVLPKLALDFTTAVLDPRVTFTRTTGASNPATYVASNGYLTSATNNQPRFDYDPITLVCKGLLIEESRTNTLTYSGAASNAAYVKSFAYVVPNNSDISPTELVTNGTFAGGATTGWTAVDSTLSIVSNQLRVTNNGAVAGYAYQAVSGLTIGQTYQLSIYATGYGVPARYSWRDSLGVAGNNIIAGAGSATIAVQVTATATTMYVIVGNRNDNNGYNTFDNISLRALVANTAGSPSGTNTSEVVGSTEANGSVTQAYTASAASYTYSVWLKRKTGTGDVQIAADSGTWTTQTITSSWARYSVTQTVAAGSKTAGIRLVTSGDEVYVYGQQLELGAFATSYIPTTSAALTRNADVATMTGTNFSSWYNASEGTLLSWFTTEPGTTGNLQRCGLAFSDGTTSNRIVPIINTSTAMLCLVTAGGVSQAGLAPTTTNIFSGQNKVALAYKQDNFGACINAGTVQTDVSGTVPTVTQAQIARVENAAGNFLNGWVQKCFYYPQRLTDAQLQAITK